LRCAVVQRVVAVVQRSASRALPIRLATTKDRLVQLFGNTMTYFISRIGDGI
jgi:hypothetical protein